MENSTHILEKSYTISISETDCANRLKIVALLNHMQDVAEKSINKVGAEFSCDELAQKGLGWFIIRYRIEVFDNLKNIKEINIKTESRGCQKSTSYRDFEVVDTYTNKTIVKAISSWLMVNLKTKSIINIPKEYPQIRLFEARENDLKLNKLNFQNDFDKEKSFEIRYDDLDVNGHVNNTTYITWALETLNYDFRLTNNIKSIDIYFKHEAKFGDSIISQLKVDEANNSTHHVIKNANTNEELCLLKIDYN